VYGLPLAFVVFSWLASTTFPDFLEVDESFVSGLQARSSAIVTPRSTSSSNSTRTVDWQRPAAGTSFTQLPGPPQLIHYLLLGAGLRDLSWQVLIISLLGTAITAALLLRLFGQPALFVVALAVVLDHAGFLAWTLNASRIWMFVLFFGLVLAVTRDKPIWFGALAFCLIQLDYRIATFVGVTAIAFSLLAHQWLGWRFLVAGLVGAALPLAVFTIEVTAFYGWDDLQHELTVGQAWLGTLGVGPERVRYLFQAGHGPLLLMQTVARDTHNVPVFIMVIGGLVSSLFAMSRDWITDEHRFLANLTVSAVVGTIVASSTAYTQFVEGFVNMTLPVACFVIAPALGAVALELKTLIGLRWNFPHLGTLSTVAVLIPLVMASVVHLRPSVEVDLKQALPSSIRQHLDIMPSAGSLLGEGIRLGQSDVHDRGAVGELTSERRAPER
jgi:hypothetical protein